MNLQPAFELINFLAQILFLVFAAYLLVRFLLLRTQPVDFHLSLMVVFFSLVVPLTALLGLLEQLAGPTMLLGTVLIFLVCAMAFVNRVMVATYLWSPFQQEKAEPDFGWVPAIFTVTLCSAGLVSALNASPIEHDVMTYHLFFPARWIQEGRIFYIPSVFGDLAPTYAPQNAEAIFAFISLPFGNDILARAGQFPFLLMSILAVYLLARQMGVSARSATVPAALAVLSPVVFRQGFSAEVDLILGATFAAGLYYLGSYRKQPSPSVALLFGLCLGLFLGTKFVAVTFSPLLILPFFYYTLRSHRQRAFAAFVHLVLAGAAALATGGFWYLRNWIVTGNPLFPLDLSPVFRGVFGRAAMEQSPFHIPQAGYILPVWIHAYGPSMVPVAVAAMAIGLSWIVRRKSTGFSAYVYLLPWLMALIHFSIVPYNTQYRFLIPAVLLSFIPMGALDESPRLRWPVRAFWGVFLILTLLGFGRSFQVGAVPISGMGLAPKAYFVHFLLLLSTSGLFFFLIRKRKLISPIALAGAFFACFAAGMLLMPLLFSGHSRQIVAVRSNPASDYPIQAWSYVNDLPDPAVVAYSGNNVPYYLLGKNWQHKVLYVNICGPDDFLLHDYFRQCRTLPQCPLPSTTDKPGFLWRLQDLEAWMKNLRNTGADVLFVTPLSPMEAVYIPHDTEGYPIERTWADGMEDVFQRQGEFPDARIYRIDRIALFNRISIEKQK